MKRAKQILENHGRLLEAPCSERAKLNEKVEISPDMAKDIKAAFGKAGFTVDINTSTNGSVYMDGLWNAGGRYVNLSFDKGGFLVSISTPMHGCQITQAEALKLQAELKTATDLLEKIKAINPELV